MLESESRNNQIIYNKKQFLVSSAGETTTASFYKAYEGCERQKMYSEHPVNLTLNTDKFEGVTTARHSYPAYR